MSEVVAKYLVLTGNKIKYATDGIIEPEEIISFTINLNNCCESLEAALLIQDDQQLYYLSFTVAESLKFNSNEVAHTVWNILCWVRQSMSSMIYKIFQTSDIIKHDLNDLPMDKIFPCIESNLVLIFTEDKHYQQAVRYLQVLQTMMQEKLND